MVSYGPWTQDPDYTKTLGGYYPTNIDSDTHSELVDDPADPIVDAALVDTVVADSRTAWSGTGTSIGGIAGALKTRVGFHADPGHTWNDYKAERNYGLLTFSAYSGNLNGWVPTLPPDAIGYEWEDGGPTGLRRSQVLSAVWNMSVTTYNRDNLTGSDTSGGWWTEIRATTGLSFGSMVGTEGDPDPVNSWDYRIDNLPVVEHLDPKPHLTRETYTVDLSGVMFGPPEAGYIGLFRIVEGAPGVTDTGQSGAGYSVGALYDLTYPLTYTFRPPRYRLIYDTATTPAVTRPTYNRIVQRGNDGLGMSGGRRIVQSRTMQSTNRRGSVIR